LPARFNYLGRSVTLSFPFDGLFFQPIFYVSRENEENLSITSLNFCKMYHRISFGLALRLSVRQFQMLVEVLSFVKTLAAFGIISATDSPIQNIVRISFL